MPEPVRDLCPLDGHRLRRAETNGVRKSAVSGSVAPRKAGYSAPPAVFREFLVFDEELLPQEGQTSIAHITTIFALTRGSACESSARQCGTLDAGGGCSEELLLAPRSKALAAIAAASAFGEFGPRPNSYRKRNPEPVRDLCPLRGHRLREFRTAVRNC